MAKIGEARRKCNARIIMARAEEQASKLMAEATKDLKSSPATAQLKYLHVITTHV